MTQDPGWYVGLGEQTLGPLSGQQVLAMVSAGQLGRDADVCRVGATDWRRLAEVPLFARALPPSPTLQPPPPPRRPLASAAGVAAPPAAAARALPPAAPAPVANFLPLPPPIAPGAPTSSASAPRVWNPDAATNWSLLFSPLFGSILLALNWRALGQDAKAARALVWGGLPLVLVALLLIGDRPGTGASALPFLLPMYFFETRAQRALLATLPHERRSWAAPLSVGVLTTATCLACVLIAPPGGSLAGGTGDTGVPTTATSGPTGSVTGPGGIDCSTEEAGIRAATGATPNPSYAANPSTAANLLIEDVDSYTLIWTRDGHFDRAEVHYRAMGLFMRDWSAEAGPVLDEIEAAGFAWAAPGTGSLWPLAKLAELRNQLGHGLASVEAFAGSHLVRNVWDAGPLHVEFFATEVNQSARIGDASLDYTCAAPPADVAAEDPERRRAEAEAEAAAVEASGDAAGAEAIREEMRRALRRSRDGSGRRSPRELVVGTWRAANGMLVETYATNGDYTLNGDRGRYLVTLLSAEPDRADLDTRLSGGWQSWSISFPEDDIMVVASRGERDGLTYRRVIDE